MKNISSNTYCRKKSGYATLEIIIALFILSSAITSSTVIAFGNQNLLVDTTADREALEQTKMLLETTEMQALKNFQSLKSFATTSGAFETSVEVTSRSYTTKELKTKVQWKNMYNQTKHITLFSLVTDFQNNSEGDTCEQALSGDWTKPEIKNSVKIFKDLVSDPSGIYSITDLDVYHDKLFVTTNNSGANKETFFVFDVTNIENPTLVSKVDNDPLNNTGLNAVTIASTTGGIFAYVASGSSYVKGQLQIINISTDPPTVVKTYKIPTSIVSGSSSQGVPARIAYSNGYVYLGLTKTVSGPEFNIIDVRNPNAPAWIGGFQIGSQVNDIVIKGHFAYIASPHTEELIILDITDPTHPTQVGGYNAPSPNTTGSGKSVYLSGDTVYLGRTTTTANPEFYIVDGSNPRTYMPTVLGTKEINSSVNQLLVRDTLTFLLTTTGQLQIWDTRTPSTIKQFTTPLILPSASRGVALDCEKNVLFVGSVPTIGAFTDQGFLSIISTP